MMFSRKFLFPLRFPSAAAITPAFAQELPNEGPVPTTALINVQSKNNAPLNTAALKLEVNGHAAHIASVTPVQGGRAGCHPDR